MNINEFNNEILALQDMYKEHKDQYYREDCFDEAMLWHLEMMMEAVLRAEDLNNRFNEERKDR